MKFLLLLFPILSVIHSNAQNVGIGTGTPDASAMLDIRSNSKGLLIPRMTDQQRNAINAPQKGLMVFVTTDSSFYYYGGTGGWKRIASDNDAWNTTGNASGTARFIGTLDNSALRFRTNNIERMTLESNGFLGINNTTPLSGLHMVDNGSLSTDLTVEYNNDGIGYPAAIMRKSRGTYTAKTSLVPGELIGAFQFEGFGGNDYHIAAAVLGLAEDSFNTSGKRRGGLQFMTNNGASLVARMVLTNTGNVGIGTLTPTSKLQISGIGGLRVHTNNGGFGTIDWIAGNFGSAIGSNGPRVVMGTLYGTATIGGHNSELSNWADLSLQPDGGNVGIGTSFPLMGLHVSSRLPKDYAVDLQPLAFFSSNEQLAGAPFGLRMALKGASSLGNRSISLQTTDYYAADGGDILLQSFAGKVGIGTVSPLSDKLTINGGVNIFDPEGSFRVHAYYGGSNGTSLLATFHGNNFGPQLRFETSSPDIIDIGMNGDGSFVVEGNDVARLTVTNSGNVGIGTTAAPTAKLEVNGQVKITGGSPGAGKVLTSDANGLASWSTPATVPTSAYFRAWKSANQTIAASTTTTVNWENTSYVNNGTFSANKFTVNTAGVYHISYSFFAQTTSSSATLNYYIFVNGVSRSIGSAVINVSGTSIESSDVLSLAAGDAVEVRVQASGVSYTISGNTESNARFSAFKVN